MRTSALGLAAAVLLLAGCGADDPGERNAEATTSATPTATASPGRDPVGLDHRSPEALAKASPVVLLGTISSWEDGPTLVLAERGGGEQRVPYAVAVVAVDQVIKDRRGLVTGDQILVPVRLDEGGEPWKDVAPPGSNVAFLGGAEVGFNAFDTGGGTPELETEPGSPLDLDSVLWAGPQGLVLETPSGELVNADPYARSPLWPDVVAVPAGERFGMLAGRLMALRGAG